MENNWFYLGKDLSINGAYTLLELSETTRSLCLFKTRREAIQAFKRLKGNEKFDDCTLGLNDCQMDNRPKSGEFI